MGSASLDTLSLSIGQQNKEVKRLLKEMIEDKLVGLDTVEDYFITVEGVDMYQQVLSDVAIGQATLEVTDDGYIIATHSAFGKVQIH
jgi:predicted transcriptional regulator